ncbi:MAG: YiiX/YebB-like N1pC/P60 family cysteine hydrolase [Betaproteobacteria bacterium]|nr:YiiX/YebB-like N1pC/P60 family cysteine hydrolase [Betaproteobacteria bacterium]MDH3437415.1 YiiX/YebB-like N1pC/P60 family cysteine hydrolase [Betaproteobacteria bacterium]
MTGILARLGGALAAYLSRPSPSYEPLTTSQPGQLRSTLRPGDVLLVEGNTRIAVAIKYLTQSTWSHAALYIGDRLAQAPDDPDPPALIEADVMAGVRVVPLSLYETSHTRICRPVGLRRADLDRIIEAAVARIGDTYDLRNVIDLARYLFPTPPVPQGWRRRMIALGSGQPTRAICSTMIAQLFQSVCYPILPEIESRPAPRPGCDDCVREIYHIRHHSLFAPRDFDISPYFEVVKPVLDETFDYHALVWARGEGAPPGEAVHAGRLNSSSKAE